MNKVKAFVIFIVSALMNCLGVLAVPVFLLVGCNLLDYATGLMAAKYRSDGGISSYKSIRGITKKVCMWGLVLLGAFLDVLLQYAVETMGLALTLPFIVATIVAVWLVINEMISILENMVDIGVTMPPFLMPIVKYIKQQVEDKADMDKGEEKHE